MENAQPCVERKLNGLCGLQCLGCVRGLLASNTFGMYDSGLKVRVFTHGIAGSSQSSNKNDTPEDAEITPGICSERDVGDLIESNVV